MNKEIYLKEYPKHKDMRENVKRDKNRLHFHMMPPTGWMNDPNGLCQFQGINHIYFQYTPFLAGWGTKLWGHYTTKDWVHYVEYCLYFFDCKCLSTPQGYNRIFREFRQVIKCCSIFLQIF